MCAYIKSNALVFISALWPLAALDCKVPMKLVSLLCGRCGGAILFFVPFWYSCSKCMIHLSVCDLVFTKSDKLKGSKDQQPLLSLFLSLWISYSQLLQQLYRAGHWLCAKHAGLCAKLAWSLYFRKGAPSSNCKWIVKHLCARHLSTAFCNMFCFTHTTKMWNQESACIQAIIKDRNICFVPLWSISIYLQNVAFIFKERLKVCEILPIKTCGQSF